MSYVIYDRKRAMKRNSKLPHYMNKQRKPKASPVSKVDRIEKMLELASRKRAA